VREHDFPEQRITASPERTGVHLTGLVAITSIDRGKG
jgi:hypothetical protein